MRLVKGCQLWELVDGSHMLVETIAQVFGIDSILGTVVRGDTLARLLTGWGTALARKNEAASHATRNLVLRQ